MQMIKYVAAGVAAGVGALGFAAFAPLIAGAVLGMLFPALMASDAANVDVTAFAAYALGLALMSALPLLIVWGATKVLGPMAWLAPAGALVIFLIAWLAADAAAGTLSPAGVVVQVGLYAVPAAVFASLAVVRPLRRQRDAG